jgi:hypothetical protein
MKPQPRGHADRSQLVYATILAACLVLGRVSFAQTDKSSQSPGSDQSSATSQAQSGAADRSEQKPPEPGKTRLRIVVTGAQDKPVANASVYVRFNTSGGFLRHEKLMELNFKTNQDGSVKVPEVPQGKILIQVIATGWHTYGKWYDINTDEEAIAIKLAPPPHWY